MVGRERDHVPISRVFNMDDNYMGGQNVERVQTRMPKSKDHDQRLRIAELEKTIAELLPAAEASQTLTCTGCDAGLMEFDAAKREGAREAWERCLAALKTRNHTYDGPAKNVQNPWDMGYNAAVIETTRYINEQLAELDGGENEQDDETRC